MNRGLTILVMCAAVLIPTNSSQSGERIQAESDIVFAMCDRWFRGPSGQKVPIEYDLACLDDRGPRAYRPRGLPGFPFGGDTPRCSAYRLAA